MRDIVSNIGKTLQNGVVDDRSIGNELYADKRMVLSERSDFGACFLGGLELGFA